ncbi:hypothetical protein SPD48_06280 [Pseudogracilibacillus sp. SE30717A]|uniref:SHOCT-like domain-containing protein n=1 Tax=Pseudogracilibacillus sp. SE30717A TaxID=3098293 RepID=UPI00300E09CF
MQDEIEKIINMVQEGKITSDEAGELIAAIKAEPKAVSTSNKGYLGKMLKIRIQSETEENVKVNIPIGLVKFLLKMGHGIASHIPESQKYVKDIDLDLVMHAIDTEMEGKIVDIQSEDGEIVEIYIE